MRNNWSRGYLAAALKTEEMWQRNRDIRDFIHSRWDLNLFLPQEHFILSPNASRTQRQEVMRRNRMEIISRDFVIAVLDEKDGGVAYEMGYADGHCIPVLALYTIKDQTLNVMLSETAMGICRSLDDLTEYFNHGCLPTYDGKVE